MITVLITTTRTTALDTMIIGMDIMAMIIKGSKTNQRNVLILLIMSLFFALCLFIVLKIIITHRIYAEINFYLAILIVIGWLSLVVFIPYMSRRWLHLKKNSALMTILFGMVLVAGVIGSFILGDIWFKQGALPFLIAMTILFLFGIIMLSRELINRIRNGKANR
jgi:hypothetical protein